MCRVITNPTGSVVDASEVKILYESNENTNAYTDGDKASLGEVKDAIDMAKKVVEITFLLNDWTSNSDGTYSQTVNNSEIKSSMNPDLISMLSSGANPEEQKAYMKNFSILCQGVGNTADGSVTYKIYKQMTGDITVGLTRLGGVRQIESEAKVDDVKVGGVSVVENKIAKIPAIPKSNVIINHIALGGLNGDAYIEKTKTYDVILIISESTPLPLSKYINAVMGYSASDDLTQVFPNTQGQMTTTPITIMVAKSLISGTFVYGFQFTVQVAVDHVVNDSTGETSPLGRVDASSLSVNITTDGIELSLDKAKSSITALEA